MPDDEESAEKSGLPAWYSELDPETAQKLEVLEPDELFGLQATIEWYDGGPPAHIAVRELDAIVPGSGKMIIDEGLERSKLERAVIDRHSRAGTRQSWISLLVASLMGLGALAFVGYFLLSKAITTQHIPILIVLMIVGVGGPIAAAHLAQNRTSRDDQEE